MSDTVACLGSRSGPGPAPARASSHPEDRTANQAWRRAFRFSSTQHWVPLAQASQPTSATAAVGDRAARVCSTDPSVDDRDRMHVMNPREKND